MLPINGTAGPRIDASGLPQELAEGQQLLSDERLPAVCPRQRSSSRHAARERRFRLPAFLTDAQGSSRDVAAGARGPLGRQPLLTGAKLGAAACDRWGVAVGANGTWLGGWGRGDPAPLLLWTSCLHVRLRLVLLRRRRCGPKRAASLGIYVAAAIIICRHF